MCINEIQTANLRVSSTIKQIQDHFPENVYISRASKTGKMVNYEGIVFIALSTSGWNIFFKLLNYDKEKKGNKGGRLISTDKTSIQFKVHKI